MSLLRLSFSIICICVLLIPAAYAGNLQGVVVDAQDGTVIAGAQVVALTYTADGDSLFYEAQTGNDGRYTINDMAPYSYVVWCQHPDYIQRKVSDFVVSDNANLALDFRLDRIHHPHHNTRLAGTVYSAPDMMPAVIPLAGAKVKLFNDAAWFETHSNNDGRYSFHNIPPGDYRLTATAPHHQPYEHVDIISVAEGDIIEDLDFYLVPLPYPNTSTVFGTITASNDDTPVYPAYVTLIPLYYALTDGPLPVDPEVYAVINNPDGSYIVENIPSGDYIMICSAQKYKWQRIEAVTLEDQEVKVDFFMEALDASVNNLITGTIYEYPARGHVLPLVNVYLTYIDPPIERPEILYHSLSDGFGHYQFYDLPSGKAALQFSKPGYELLMDTLDVAADTWLTEQDYSMKPLINADPIVLTGFVYENTGSAQPVHPAHIQLYTINSAGDQLRYDTVNNPDGSYIIRGIRPGTYTAVCSAMGYEKEIVPNLVLSELQHTLDFYLKPHGPNLFGKIQGRVHFDRLNQPVAGALINFLPKYIDLTGYDVAYYTTTNDDGTYEMMLPEDEYIVSCQYWSPEGWYFYQEYYDDVHSIADATPIKLKRGETVPGINFGIPYPAIVSSVTIKGHVSDDGGNALAQAMVNVRPFDLTVHAFSAADNVYQTRTDDDGNYVIEIDLYWLTIPTPVLGFIVSASKDGYMTEFYKERKTPYEADILWAFSDTTFSKIDFTLDPLNQVHAITGTVTSAAGAIPHAFIIGVHASSGEVSFAVSGNNGDYRLGGLRRGYYFLLFVASGYLPEFYNNARVWEDADPVWVDGIVPNINAELTPMPSLSANINGVVSGRILDKDGNPLSGAMVTMQLRDGPVNAYGLSDSDGMFEMPWEDSGEYQILISKVNYSSYSAWIQVGQEGAPTNSLLFTLESTFTGLPDDGSGRVETTIPTAHRLYNNYPNPFNPLTNIRFELPQQQQVSLVVYNILGHRVRNLIFDTLPAGMHTVTWDATDQSGYQVASGIYFYVLQTPGTRLVGKMILQK
jgi:protocatechuate 3,4-dioxygenase beta subunit